MKTRFKTFAVPFFFAALIAVSSTSCGTVRGFGRDVGAVGDNIQRSAR